MTRAWETLARESRGGRVLELRRRGDDFLLLEDGRVLMNSHADRSERLLARLACAELGGAAPRVLVAGLGMGITLRAALDLLPAGAHVVVAEREPQVAAWCRGPLAPLCGGALDDPRTRLHTGDVAEVLGEAASRGPAFDAVLLDLSEGPPPARLGEHPHYGRRALARTAQAIAPGGVLAVWSEQPSAAFERELRRLGLSFRCERASGARRHAVYVARRAGGGTGRGAPGGGAGRSRSTGGAGCSALR